MARGMLGVVVLSPRDSAAAHSPPREPRPRLLLAKSDWVCGCPIPETISASFPRRWTGQIGICAEARPSRRHASSGEKVTVT